MLDLDLRQEWIKALENGEWKQGKYTLKKEDKFCCLGVVCELYRRKTNQGEWVVSSLEEGREGFNLGKETVDEYLPESLMISLGLTIAQTTHLATCNDDYNMDFVEIANKIKDMRIAI